MGVVQDVEGLRAELDHMLFTERDPSRDGQVDHVVSRSVQRVSTNVAECSSGRAGEGCRVEPQAGCGIREVGIANQVQALARRRAGQRYVAATQKVQRST